MISCQISWVLDYCNVFTNCKTKSHLFFCLYIVNNLYRVAISLFVIMVWFVSQLTGAVFVAIAEAAAVVRIHENEKGQINYVI